ncbi:MAG: hypothetical protein J6T70_20335 [Bacteroidales bacterium]|nr:hypothetical protein [Bacteroidales bacterium]
MKKLTLFFVASVMLSSTFLSASCGDDEDEVKPEEIVDEWLSDKAIETNDFYNLYEYDETLVYNEQSANITPGNIKDNINYNDQKVEAKAQILSETNIDQFGTIKAMSDLKIEAQIDPKTQNCYTAAVLLMQIQNGQILAMEVNSKKIVAKAVEIDANKKSVHLKGYALFQK